MVKKVVMIAGLILIAMSAISADTGRWVQLNPKPVPNAQDFKLTSSEPSNPPDNNALWGAQWLNVFSSAYYYWTWSSGYQIANRFYPANFGLTYPLYVDSIKCMFYAPGSFPYAPIALIIYADNGTTQLARFPVSGTTTPNSSISYPNWQTWAFPTPATVTSGTFYAADSLTSSYPATLSDGGGSYGYYTWQGAGAWYQIGYNWAIQAFVRPASASVADIAVVSIPAPGINSTPAMNVGTIPDTVYTGLAYTSSCSTKNNSTTAAGSVPVNERITEPGSPTYTDALTVGSIPAGATVLATFPNPWTSGKRAGLTYTIKDSVALGSDPNPANNARTKTVYVKGDVAAIDGIDPTGEVYVNQIYNPYGKIKNLTPGFTELFPITLTVIDEGGGVIYNKTRNDSLLANETKGVAGDDWKVPDKVGAVYEINLKVALPGDFNPLNDLYQWYVTAVAQPGIDVGADTILVPGASVKQGELFKPKAVVHNYGTGAATFDVRCIIDQDTLPVKSVTSLAKDATEEVTFDDWSSDTPGPYWVEVYTMLAGDGNRSNDTFKLSFTVTGVNETGKPKPTRYALNAARPNPVSDWTDIGYSLPENTFATVAIYDVTGKAVRTLASGFDLAGQKLVRWDGRDGSGALVPNGLYFVRFETPRYAATGKLVLTR